MKFEQLGEAMELGQSCKWCIYCESNEVLGGQYWTKLCTRYEVPIVINPDYCTCENWKKKHK